MSDEHQTQQPGPPEPELWFHRLATHYVEAQVLYHLNAVGVFRALEQEAPAAPETLAERLGLEIEPLRVLLEYAEGVDHLLSRDADGRYAFTDWGRRVVERFSRVEDGVRHLNLFDVRVGAYGDVWSALGRLVSGEVSYGRDLVRAGEAAADAVYKVSARFAPALCELLSGLGVRSVVELGVPSGLVVYVGRSPERARLHGLDRDAGALRVAEERARAAGVDDVAWIRADVFDVDAWGERVASPEPGALVSIHLHEFLAAGEDAVVRWLRALGERFPGWRLVAVEQPRLDAADRAETPEAHWLYDQSNVLIHHLIGNGRVLPDEAWRALFERGGGAVESSRRLGFLGYRAYVVELGAAQSRERTP